MKITRLLDRNKITIRRQRQSRGRITLRSPSVNRTEKKAAATIRGRRPSPNASYLLATSKLYLPVLELAIKGGGAEGSLSGGKGLDLSAMAGAK